jgi:hypothetical protein
MKKFESFQDALAYQTKCPICQTGLKIDNLETKVTVERDRTIVTWESPSTKLCVDISSNIILNMHVTRSMSYSPTYSIGTRHVTYVPSHSQQGQTSSGHLMERLIIGCRKCCQYEYVVRVIVEPPKLDKMVLLLNSESITLDDKDITHEIRNIYSFGQTEYTRYANAIAPDSKSIRIPLIPMELQNPLKMLERIKTLVLFS